MTRPFSPASLITVLLLHAGLIGWAITVLPTRVDTPPEPLTVAVQLLPVQEEKIPEPQPAPAPAPPPVVPEPSPSPPPPEPKPIKPKPVKPKPVPKPAPKPEPKAPAKPRPSRESATPEVKAETVAPEASQPSAAPAPASSAVTAAPPASAPAAPAAPPVKTNVYIPAEYAAANPKPVYPAMSKRYGDQGTVVLRVFVKADGTAGQVEVRSSSGFPLLDESAKTAVQGWRFRPATSDGKPIADWFLIPIPFKLQN
jgi:protein TonB